MWFFRRKAIPKPHKQIQRVLVGFVIGAAISSIVGKKMMDRSKGDDGEESDEDRDS